MTPEEFFTDKRILDRYYYAVDLAKQLIKYQTNSYKIFDAAGELVKGTFEYKTEFTKDSWSIVELKEDNCLMILIDIEYSENNNPWIDSKAGILEEFKNI